MARTATGIIIAVAVLLLAFGTAAATTLHWTPAPALAPQGSEGGLAACDLDADGDWDVSCVQTGEEFWNVGTPQAPAWELVSGVVPHPADCMSTVGTYGDLDADGDYDLIYGCFEPPMYMFWNMGTPQVPEWQSDDSALDPVEGSYFAAPCLGDMDADGDLDIVMTSAGQIAWLFENTGSPQVPQWTSWGQISGIYLPGSEPKLVLGDLDGDGDLDIVGGTRGTGVLCWENVGTPQNFQFVQNPDMLLGVDNFRRCYQLALLDVDGDGDLDLLVTGIPFGGSSGRFLYLNEAVTLVTPTTWSSIKALYR